jgi:hypothetical protein
MNSFLIACLFVMGRSALAQVWQYEAIDTEKGGIVIQRNPNQVSIGDLAWDDMEFCDSARSFYCFDAHGMEFAIPKNFVPSTKKQSWNFRGKDYTATSVRQPLTIIGRQYHIIYIDTVNQTPNYRFIYSTERGLVGIKGLDEQFKLVFLLEQACGFAAPSGCH